MHCPPEIAAIVGEILTTGLLRIRASQDAERAALEADHLHNLPALLTDFKPELLHFYWHVERRCFIEQCAPNENTGFETLWQVLGEHLQPANHDVALARTS